MAINYNGHEFNFCGNYCKHCGMSWEEAKRTKEKCTKEDMYLRMDRCAAMFG